MRAKYGEEKSRAEHWGGRGEETQEADTQKWEADGDERRKRRRSWSLTEI